MDSKKYICVNDLQGETFGTYRFGSARGWVEQACEWCYMDEDTATMVQILSLWANGKDKEAIEYISEFWEIEIEEYDESKDYSEPNGDGPIWNLDDQYHYTTKEGFDGDEIYEDIVGNEFVRSEPEEVRKAIDRIVSHMEEIGA